MSLDTAKKIFELEKPVDVVAIAQGYYNNRIVYPGQKFQYNGGIKKNRKGEYVLPLWTEIDKSVKGNEIKVKDDVPKPSPKRSKSAKQKEIKDLV